MGSWKQGAFVDAGILPLSPDQAISGVRHYLIISHSCDLARDESKDPWVEVLPCRLMEKPDSADRRGANPRRLCLDYVLKDGTKLSCELLAYEKLCIAKSGLAGSTSACAAMLEKDQLEVLVNWLAARYKRQALDSRLDASLRPFSEKLEKLMTKGDFLVGVWLAVEPPVEQEPYECQFYLVYDLVEDPDGERTKGLHESLEPVIEELQSQSQPVLIHIHKLSEANMTLYLQRKSVRWYYDFISHKTKGPIS